MNDIDNINDAINQTIKTIAELASGWDSLTTATHELINEIDSERIVWERRAKEAENALTDAVVEISTLRTELAMIKERSGINESRGSHQTRKNNK